MEARWGNHPQALGLHKRKLERTYRCLHCMLCRANNSAHLSLNGSPMSSKFTVSFIKYNFSFDLVLVYLTTELYAC